MKLSRKKRKHSVAFNITPMIDIVFLLIIFFMTVSQITRVVDHPLDLPKVAAASSDVTNASVTLNVDQAGDIIVSGKKYALNRTIQILQKKINQLDGNTDKLKLELRCDGGCPSGQINRIIEELSNLGIQYINIAVAKNG